MDSNDIQNKEIIERVTRVETQIDSLSSTIREMKNNHLMHIEKDVKELSIRVHSLTTKVAVISAIAVVGAEVISRLFL